MPIGGVRVSLSGTGGESYVAVTNPFGYYRFDEIEVGQTYIFEVRSKRYLFAPQMVSVTDEMTELNFTAEP